MAEPFRSPKWRLWVQPDGPNTAVQYLGCHTLDDVEAPGSGIKDLIKCFKKDRDGWDVLGSTRNPPDPLSTTVTGLIESAADYLEEIVEGANCPFPLYVNGKLCPPYDVFAGAARWYAMEQAEIGTTTLMGLAHREEDNISEQSFEITALPPLLRGRAIETDRIEFTGTENLNDIASCSIPRCAGDCGVAVDVCDTLVAVAEGDPASADVWMSFDHGINWTASLVDPYLGLTSDLKSVCCFPIDSDTTRILVARDGVAGMPMHVYYSDDWGANPWTDVVVGGSHDLGASWGGSMFCIDQYHIWLVITDETDSEVWFSDDAGETWTQQLDVPGVVLYAVHFSDENTGMIVGDTDTVYVTTNGGDTWAVAAGAPTSGDNLLHVTENQGGGIWWAMGAAGELWYSGDHGVTWAQRAFPGDEAGNVFCMEWYSETVGYMVHSPTAATGRVYRSRNGGYTWELESQTYAGELYSVITCKVNEAFTVGEQDTTALVLHTHD